MVALECEPRVGPRSFRTGKARSDPGLVCVTPLGLLEASQFAPTGGGGYRCLVLRPRFPDIKIALVRREQNPSPDLLLKEVLMERIAMTLNSIARRQCFCVAFLLLFAADPSARAALLLFDSFGLGTANHPRLNGAGAPVNPIR